MRRDYFQFTTIYDAYKSTGTEHASYVVIKMNSLYWSQLFRSYIVPLFSTRFKCNGAHDTLRNGIYNK